jgi:Outer membrane efflux protein
VDRVQRPHAVTIEQRALDQNLDLDAALARVRQTRAAASGAGAELLPTADLGASATFEHQSLRGEFGSVAAGSPGFKRDGHADVVGRQRAGKSISSAGYAEARRRLEMTHRRLKPIRWGLGRHGVAKAPVADQRLQCETSHKPPLLNAVHLDSAAPNNLYWPPDEWLKRGRKSRSER